ncbi:MAG: hypothetical protein KC621_29025, partial [Myxococcales bacterium]|nr:hypothetical protein [Myxococcales bacterium]
STVRCVDTEQLSITVGPGLDDYRAVATYTLRNDGEAEVVRYAVPIIGTEASDPKRLPPEQRTHLKLGAVEVPCTVEDLDHSIELPKGPAREMASTSVGKVCRADLTIPGHSTSTLVLTVDGELVHESWSTSKDVMPGVSDRELVWMFAPAGSWAGGSAKLTMDVDLGRFGTRATVNGPKGATLASGHVRLVAEAVDLKTLPPLDIALAVEDVDRQEQLVAIARGPMWRPASATASSTLAGQGKVTYAADHLIDGDPKTAWCEGVDGDGVGQTLELRWKAPPEQLPVYFRPDSCVLAVGVLPGYASSRSAWTNNARAAELTLRPCEGEGSVRLPLKPSADPLGAMELHTVGELIRDRTPEEQAVLGAVFGSWLATPSKGACLRIEVSQVLAGAKYQDLCLSELAIFPSCGG